jgi:hypothetical protein
MTITTCDHYLRDALTELIDRARALRDLSESDEAAKAFHEGRITAYYEVVSYMLQQLDAFGMSRERYEIPVDFDPIEFLNGTRR